MTARPDYDGDEAGRCGGCGSRNLTTVSMTDTKHGKCKDCGRFQEVEQRDWPEAELCDNCAFRKGSPERRDPYKWADIEELVKEGRMFHCHKGLPLDAETGQFSPPDPANGRVTCCAGWLRANLAHLKRLESAQS